MMAHCHHLWVEQQHFLLDLELSICCHQWWEIHNSLKNVEGMDYCKRLFIIIIISLNWHCTPIAPHHNNQHHWLSSHNQSLVHQQQLEHCCLQVFRRWDGDKWNVCVCLNYNNNSIWFDLNLIWIASEGFTTVVANEGLEKARAYLNQVPQYRRLYIPSERCGVNFRWKHLQTTPTHFFWAELSRLLGEKNPCC